MKFEGGIGGLRFCPFYGSSYFLSLLHKKASGGKQEKSFLMGKMVDYKFVG